MGSDVIYYNRYETQTVFNSFLVGGDRPQLQWNVLTMPKPTHENNHVKIKWLLTALSRYLYQCSSSLLT